MPLARATGPTTARSRATSALQNSGRFKAVLHRRRVQNDMRQLGEVARRCGDDAAPELARVLGGQVALHAAGDRHAPPEARAEQRADACSSDFLDPRVVGRRNREAHVAAQRADIGDVRQHALQFQPDEAHRPAARRHGYRKRVLDSLAVGDGVGEAVIAGDRFGQHRTVA